MSSGVFEIKKSHRDGSRSGQLKTRRGQVATPFFMPVGTRAAVKGLQPQQVADTGAQVLLCNTYHLHLRPGEKTIKKLGALQAFSSWNGPILTDSGGFQVFSLANIRKITEEGVLFKDDSSGQEVLLTPEKSMQIQLDLGSDIIMAFDDLTGLSLEAIGRTQEAFERTHRWLERSLEEFQKLTKGQSVDKRPLLFGIVQGGLDKKLRAKSLELIQAQPVDGIGIGGLAVGEPRPKMYEILRYLAPLCDKQRPRYLMGVGEPVDMRIAIENGIDMFDCVLPTRNGRHGQVWLKGDKRINLNNAQFAADSKPIDPTCDCQACQTGYSRAFLRHQFRVGDPLGGSLASIHNLRYLARLCEGYR